MTNCTTHLVKKQLSISPKLIQYLDQIPDPRGKTGRRHSLVSILIIVILGTSVGLKNLKEIVEWAKSESIFNKLKRKIDLLHGIPDATTISRVFQKLNIKSLINSLKGWIKYKNRDKKEQAYSLDGKTMKGVHNNSFRHILSLFGHKTFHTLDQEVVSHKENEITASYRMFKKNKSELEGVTITADALLTQKKVIKCIKKQKADFLLTVKANNKELLRVIKSEFKTPHSSHKKQVFNTISHGRQEMTTIKITSFDKELLIEEGWEDINYVGQVIREGLRPKDQRGSSKTKLFAFHEENYFISSKRQLTPQQAYQLIKGHWRIENNLHWQKDHTYLEDRQTLRKGNSPQVMTYLRSFIISLIKNKISYKTRNFLFNPNQHFAYLKKSCIF